MFLHSQYRDKVAMAGRVVVVIAAIWACIGLGPSAAADLSKDDASAALRKAVEFFRTQVATHGGYLWQYSADLTKREGEGKADVLTAWVQPPGTPTVGSAYLRVFEDTGDTYYLEAARETAYALVNGQLASGGWAYRIDFSPDRRRKYAYRAAPGNKGGQNVSTLDDDTTQSALRYLMQVDEALSFKDEAIHEAVTYGLERLLAAQYPNGAWPQRFTGPPDPEKYPVKKASYPATWSRTYPKKDYKGHYTFNDNTIADTITTMFDATAVYGDDRFRAAAEKAGDFILLAQMPDPQPGWAQQYDADMHPAWARRFEPPAVTGGESHGVIRTLIAVYRETGKRKYLEPIPRALEYFRQSQLPGGKLARFYELETNTPLYFTKQYELTYSSDDMPTHYGFITSSWVDGAQGAYDEVKNADPAALKPSRSKETPVMSPGLADRARAAVDALDERGAWVEDGPLKYQGEGDTTSRVIDCRTFVRNVTTLGTFIAASPRIVARRHRRNVPARVRLCPEPAI